MPSGGNSPTAILAGDEILTTMTTQPGGQDAVLAAVAAAGVAFTVTDARQTDNPLVYVNPAFESSTGYPAAEVLGRNCRFMQGPDTDPGAVSRLREALAQKRPVVVTMLNYRKDGEAFWNELSVSPVYDDNGVVTHFVGIQDDVTARVLAQRERDLHLAAERAARAEAEKSQRRLTLLAEATSMLAATLDVDESLRRLTHLVVPLMADWCTVHLLAKDGQVQRAASTHVDPAKEPALRRLESLQPSGLAQTSATLSELRGGPPALLPEVSAGYLREQITDPELLEVYEELGYRSAIVVPLRARSHVLGSLSLTIDSSGRRYDESDLRVAADLARRAALTVDNARLYQREHEVAEQLQLSLLPQLAQVAGLDRDARYLPSSAAAQVGGDWYDMFELPDGAVGLAIGDVMGHDLTAAVAMGQLRSVLRSYAWQGDRPAKVLDHLDQLVQGLHMAQLATAVYARVTLPGPDDPTGPAVLRLSNAGHLPPVLRTPDGTARLLTGGRSLLVGAALGTPRGELEQLVPRGSTLVMCTDGLVEQRGRDLDAGLERLRLAVEASDGASADAICNQLLTALDGTEREDDVALLVVRVL